MDSVIITRWGLDLDLSLNFYKMLIVVKRGSITTLKVRFIHICYLIPLVIDVSFHFHLHIFSIIIR